MPTAVETSYVFAKLDELEPAARLAPGARTTGGSASTFAHPRHPAFGVSAFSAPSGVHRHQRARRDPARRGRPGGALHRRERRATFEIDGESVEAPTGALVNVQPTAKRKATATEDGTTILVVGGTAGKAYEPAPEESAEAFAAYTAGDYEEALAKQLVVSRSSRTIPWRTSTSGASRREPDTPTRRSRPSGGRSRSTTASRS
jgi:hypothetical protein